MIITYIYYYHYHHYYYYYYIIIYIYILYHSCRDYISTYADLLPW